MVKKNKKNIYLSGFSLFEACVVMLIVAVFIAMCANAYTKRHVTYQESDGHGRYECYRNGGVLVQRYVENNSARNVGGTTCVFRPPRYAKYLLINAIGGGSGDAAGTFVSVFYNAIDQPLTIEPGAAGASTVVKDAEQNDMVTADAGGGDMSVINSAADRVAKCTVGNGIDTDGNTLNFDCSGSTPICAQDGTNLVVYYCKADQSFQRLDIPLAEVKANRRSYSSDTNTINYEDLQDYINVGHMDASDALELIRNGKRPYNSYFTLTVEFDMSTSKESQMGEYLNLLGIVGEDTIQEIGPGEPGKPGGVVILW